MPAQSIVGASVWEQEIYEHVVRHVESEREVLQAYERLADETDSPAFAYLARLILDDERRHHQMLYDLAETIRTTASLSGEPTPIPDLGVFKADRERILEETERFLAVEETDNRELDRLAKDLKDTRNTTLWQLIVRVIQDDNDKHRRVLTFVRDRARERQ
jgi:rubrerythrin